jgi:hypothetical protein
MASHNRPPITCPPFPEGFEPGYTSGQASLRRGPPPALLPLGLSGGSGDGRQPGDWECPECGEVFVRDTELQTHMKADHDIEMVLPPQTATVLKQETSAAEEEEEEVNKNPPAAATEEQEVNSSTGERGSRGKKRKRGRGREESGGERRGEEATPAAEVLHELAETEEAMGGGGGGGGEAKLPGNYYCDAPVCLILQYPHT